MAIDRLTSHLFDGASDDLLAEEVAAWLADSARYRAFVDAHRDKIRKKLRGARDREARRDVRAELRVAHLLLADRRIALAFEASGSVRGGPDFTVAFRRERDFNLEVTRLRRLPDSAGLGRPLLAKLRQLPPSMPNLLLIATDGAGVETLTIDAATRVLRSRADARDEDFFIRHGLAGARGFYDRYLRLGAVMVFSEYVAGDGRAALWTNRLARIALPQRAMRAILSCLRMGWQPEL